MSRLNTMARFAEPDEPIPITYCENCDGGLHDCQDVVKYEGDYFCSSDCLMEHIGAEEKTLYAEDY